MVARDGLAGVARVLARLGSVVRELLREASQVSEIQKETQAARRLPYPATREDRRRASLLPEGRMDTLASLATRNRADQERHVQTRCLRGLVRNAHRRARSRCSDCASNQPGWHRPWSQDLRDILRRCARYSHPEVL